MLQSHKVRGISLVKRHLVEIFVEQLSSGKLCELNERAND